MNSHVEFTGNNSFNNCTQTYNNDDPNHHLLAESILTVLQNTIDFFNYTTFLENYSEKSGGVLYASQSKIKVFGNISIKNNSASKSGGGAFLYLSSFVCRGNCTFSGNTTCKTGGGVHAVATSISIGYSVINEYKSSLILANNRAENGGGLYLEANSKLTGTESRSSPYEIGFIQNTAESDGGAVFVNDKTYLDVCASNSYSEYKTETECFFQALYNDINIKKTGCKHWVNFMNNTAMRGSVLYGGLLDRCTVSPMADIYNKSIYTTKLSQSINGVTYFLSEGGLSSQNTTDEIASDAVRICFCQNTTYDCSFRRPNIDVRKGEKFTLSVVAVDQINHTVKTSIHSYLPDGSLGEGPQLKQASQKCTDLVFNISSQNSSVELILYTDPSPCRMLSLSFLGIKINFTECKCLIGFRQTVTNVNVNAIQHYNHI